MARTDTRSVQLLPKTIIMKKIVFTLLTFFFTCNLSSAYGTEIQLPKPAPHQIKWHEAELGVVFHYDLHVFDGQVYGLSLIHI